MSKNIFVRVRFMAAVLIPLAFAGCPRPPAASEQPVVISRPAEPPQGVVRYCWQEPKVVYEQNGPGLDPEKKYYHPSYRAVREARMGRWVPCQ